MDIFQMQHQAEERVRRMEERARQVVQNRQPSPVNRPIRKDPPPEIVCASPVSDDRQEQAMLLLLALLLYRSGAGLELVVALLYLAI